MEKDPYLLSSVDHTLSLIELLSHHPSLSLAEITKLTDYDKSSIFRMLYTLSENQLVEKTEDGRYSLGIKFLDYAGKVISRQDVITTAKPFMQELGGKLNIPVHLGRLSGSRIITIHIEDEVSGPHVTGRIGMSASAHTTAMGRVCLAHLREAELTALVKNLKFKKYSERSILNVSELSAVLREVQANKYGMDLDDRYPGFGAIAVPLYDFSGNLAAAMGLVSTSHIIREQKEPYLATLNEYAGKISAALGYLP